MSEAESESNPERIHPALEFTEAHAYVGQWLNRRQSVFGLIRDDGAITRFTSGSLDSPDIELMHYSDCIHPRWSTNGIQRFARGEAETISGDQLFQRIKERMGFYLELPDPRLYDFLILWTIGTYFHPLFNTYPYAYIGGISQSGKSKLLAFCSCLSFNSVLSGNMSTASTYRLIQDSRCSLFIDEADQLSDRSRAQDLRNILLSGYRKGVKAYRSRRTPEGNFVPQGFDVFGPKMLANIEGLEEVLESRCITIIMQRTSNRDISNREINIAGSEWQNLRDLLYPFMLRNWREVKQAYNNIENNTTLVNREWELWKPILALAQFFGGTLYLRKLES